MTARDIADRISHRNDYKTECESRHEIGSIGTDTAALNGNSRSAAEKYKHKCAYAFSDTFFE